MKELKEAGNRFAHALWLCYFKVERLFSLFYVHLFLTLIVKISHLLFLKRFFLSVFLD